MSYVAENEVSDGGGDDGRKPRLLDEVRRRLRVKHYSLRTETVYVGWIKRFILANGKRHPREMGAPEVEAFLSSLAVQGQVAASTQNQALSALLFLYREVLGIDLPWMESVVRAKRPRRLPTGTEIAMTREMNRLPLRSERCPVEGGALTPAARQRLLHRLAGSLRARLRVRRPVQRTRQPARAVRRWKRSCA